MRKGICVVIISVLFFSSCGEQKKEKAGAGGEEQKKGEVVSSSSGLQYEVIRPGTPPLVNPKKGQKVCVLYQGWLDDKGKRGKEFDRCIDPGKAFTFTVGVGQVIKGWDEGVLSMSVGEKRRFVIPPQLGYGERGFPGVIPKNATLIFDVELLEIVDV